MARQSFRKRLSRYEATRQEEYDRIQRLLRRQEIRLVRGDYNDVLSKREREAISDLIQGALVLVPIGYKIVVTDAVALNKARRAYYKICAILRKAGTHKREPSTTPKIIRRKHESPTP